MIEQTMEEHNFTFTTDSSSDYHGSHMPDTEGYFDIDSEYQDNIDFSQYKTDVKMLAYYLPQFHAFKENDEWWGKGFTEWTNTRKCKPRFKGHYQPRTPHVDIGYYKLDDIETMKKQVELAKQHGIYGFCFYYYWFSGKRLMEKPVDMLLEHPEVDIPFCLCWANENWTRTWDAQTHELLMKQGYTDRDDEMFMRDIKKYLDDKRYIRINGKPVIAVYRPDDIPDCRKTFGRWREVARKIGIGEILIWTCKTANHCAEELGICNFIDAQAEFPPHNIWFANTTSSPKKFYGEPGNILNYQKIVNTLEEAEFNIREKQLQVLRRVPTHPAMMLQWDDASRRPKNWFTFHNYSLQSAYDWAALICEQARRDFPEEERFVFVNAWNEWAEGSYLEPDEKYGYANINTISKALFGLPFKDDTVVINKSNNITNHT